jgi:hypothetical protein
VAGTSVDTALQVRAAALMSPVPVVACSHTAAELLGFGVVGDGRLHLVANANACRTDPHPHQAPDYRASRRGLVFHRGGCRDGELVRIGGVLATSPARTVIDLLRALPRIDGIAVVDAALAGGQVTTGELAEQLERDRRTPGIPRARELVTLANRLAESPMESRMRLIFHDAGLPEPTPQFEVRVTRGGRYGDIVVLRYRLDLAWPKLLVAAEYDGAIHRTSTAQRADAARHNHLRAQGWKVFVFTAADVYRNSALMIETLRTALN